jgi:hypothetical protein
LLYFDQYFCGIVIVITFALLFFKLTQLSYPQGQFFIEIAILFILAFLSAARIHMGMRGNKTEVDKEMYVMILLSFFAVFTNCYFLFWQTYIMVIEVVLHYAGIGFAVLEVLFGLICVIIFKSKDQQQAKL